MGLLPGSGPLTGVCIWWLCLYAQVEIAEGIVEAGFQIGGSFALSDDEGAADVVCAGGELFGVGAGYDDAACGDTAFVFDGFGSADVDNFGGFGKDDIGAEYCFFFDDDTFDYNAAGTKEATVFDDDGAGLQGF